jgi:WD40 repeat protein
MNTSERMAELVSLYLDGALRPEEEIELLELLQEPTQRDRFLELCRLDRELAGLLAVPIDDDTMIALVRRDVDSAGPVRVPPLREAFRRSPWRLGAWLSVAAALVAAAIVGIIAFKSGDRPIAILEHTEGDVRLARDGRDDVARPGQPLFAGSHIQTGSDNSSAVIVYADGSRVELGSDTSAGQFAEGRESKRMVLEQGCAIIDRVRQAASPPLLVATPQAEIVVWDSRFALESELHGTQVEVAEGKVQLTRKLDRQSIQVEQGKYAVAAPDMGAFGLEPMTAQPIPVGSVIDAARGIRLGHKGGTSSLAFTSDGQRLASCMWSDGTVRVWDMTDLKTQGPTKYVGRTEAGWTVRFSPDGQTLAGSGNGGLLCLWDVASRELLAGLPHQKTMRAALWSPDGMTLATAGEDSAIRLRDPRTGKERTVFREAEQGWAGVFDLAFSPDGLWLASAVSDRTVRVRELPTGTLRHRLTGHTDIVRSVAFSPRDQLLASASKNEMIVWDLRTGGERFRTVGANPVAFSADGTILALGGIVPTLRDPTTGNVLARIEGHRGGVFALAFSPDRKYLAIGSWYGITLLDLAGLPAGTQQN